jgi:hypothetical protein
MKKEQLHKARMQRAYDNVIANLKNPGRLSYFTYGTWNEMHQLEETFQEDGYFTRTKPYDKDERYLELEVCMVPFEEPKPLPPAPKPVEFDPWPWEKPNE